MIGIIFKLKDGCNVVIKAKDDKMYLATDYEPSDEIEFITNKKLKTIPAKWDRLKLLEAIYDVCVLKRGLKFVIRCIEEKNCTDNIRDKKLKKIIGLVDKIFESNFEAEYLAELTKTIKKINKEVKNVKFNKKTSELVSNG